MLAFLPILLGAIFGALLLPGLDRRRRWVSAVSGIYFRIAGIPVRLTGLQNLPDEIDATLAAAQATLAAAQFQLKGDSSEVHQLGATLREVEAAARSLREFLDVMERNPESLIRGKKSK